MTAKSTIPVHWRSDKTPTKDQWFKVINELCLMEEITASIRDNYQDYLAVWLPWKEYINKKDTSRE
ncbi:hypothetical protein XENTR_v10021609 [Xenopus tropicalis]|nr:hypothetical protein XENTR_v10021609 [Xenopus tropicalis]